jgi:hypothetical protein
MQSVLSAISSPHLAAVVDAALRKRVQQADAYPSRQGVVLEDRARGVFACELVSFNAQRLGRTYRSGTPRGEHRGAECHQR